MENFDKKDIHAYIGQTSAVIDVELEKLDSALIRYVPKMIEQNDRQFPDAESFHKLSHPELASNVDHAAVIWPIVQSVSDLNKKISASNAAEDSFSVIAQNTMNLVREAGTLKQQFATLKKNIGIPPLAVRNIENFNDNIQYMAQKLSMFLYKEAGVGNAELRDSTKSTGQNR